MAESACCESLLCEAVRACSSRSQWLLLCGLGGFSFRSKSKCGIGVLSEGPSLCAPPKFISPRPRSIFSPIQPFLIIRTKSQQKPPTTTPATSCILYKIDRGRNSFSIHPSIRHNLARIRFDDLRRHTPSFTQEKGACKAVFSHDTRKRLISTTLTTPLHLRALPVVFSIEQIGFDIRSTLLRRLINPPLLLVAKRHINFLPQHTRSPSNNSPYDFRISTSTNSKPGL
jgi:hypothetical protein